MAENPFEHLGLTEHEMDIVDEIAFDLPKMVDKEEAIFALGVLIEQFKNEHTTITEENVTHLSYRFNRFLTHVNLIRIDEVLLEMFFEGGLTPILNEEDEWTWGISDEARAEYMGFHEDDDEE